MNVALCSADINLTLFCRPEKERRVKYRHGALSQLLHSVLKPSADRPTGSDQGTVIFWYLMCYWCSRIRPSRMTYIIILVVVAVVVADHRLGLPSALPLLAFVMATCLFAQLDLNPHWLGWVMHRKKEIQGPSRQALHNSFNHISLCRNHHLCSCQFLPTRAHIFEGAVALRRKAEASWLAC